MIAFGYLLSLRFRDSEGSVSIRDMYLSLRLKGFRAFRLPLPQFLRILVEFEFRPELPPGWDEHPLLPSAISCPLSGQAWANSEVHLPCVDCIITGIFSSSPTGGRRGTRAEEGCELGALCSQSLFMFRCCGSQTEVS